MLKLLKAVVAYPFIITIHCFILIIVASYCLMAPNNMLEFWDNSNKFFRKVQK